MPYPRPRRLGMEFSFRNRWKISIRWQKTFCRQPFSSSWRNVAERRSMHTLVIDWARVSTLKTADSCASSWPPLPEAIVQRRTDEMIDPLFRNCFRQTAFPCYLIKINYQESARHKIRTYYSYLNIYIYFFRIVLLSMLARWLDLNFLRRELSGMTYPSYFLIISYLIANAVRRSTTACIIVL